MDLDGDHEDLIDDFMRRNFDPPVNLEAVREKAERFCHRIPADAPVVLVSVRKSGCVAIDDVVLVLPVRRHDGSIGARNSSIRGQLLCGNSRLSVCRVSHDAGCGTD